MVSSLDDNDTKDILDMTEIRKTVYSNAKYVV